MSIELSAIDPRHARRIRLVFTDTVGVGGFTTLSYYDITCLDGGGASPGVKAAVIVSGSPQCVELILDNDLVSGSLYQVSAIGVPSATTGTSNSTELFRYGKSQQKFNTESIIDDNEVLLYLRDLVWTGTDFLETSTGDLAFIEGIANAEQAITRRVTGMPLPWDITYSPNSRKYVDGPATATISLKGAIIAQVLADDRAKSVSVTLSSDPLLPENAYFLIDTILAGGQPARQISLSV